MERNDFVTFAGNQVALLGNALKVGDKAPDFKAIDKNLKEIKLSDFDGKIKIISVAPSLDTTVCNLQAIRFNEEAAKLPPDVVIINITVDLPFAISRFCSATGVDRIKVLSDHRDVSFGNAYGVLMKGPRLLSRAVFIVDRKNIIQYIQIVKEVSQHPDYDSVLLEIKKLI